MLAGKRFDAVLRAAVCASRPIPFTRATFLTKVTMAAQSG